jgi:hypothetical protein
MGKLLASDHANHTAIVSTLPRAIKIGAINDLNVTANSYGRQLAVKAAQERG